MTDYLQPAYQPGGPVDLRTGGQQPDPGTMEVIISRYRGARGIQTGQTPVSGVATRIISADRLRRTVTITNEGSNDIYVGDENVTITTGYRIGANITRTFDLSGALYGITAGTSETVGFYAEVDRETS